RSGLANIAELNTVAVESEITFENDVESRAAGQFGFGTTGEQHGTKTGEGAYTCTDAGALGTTGDGADARPGDRGGRDRTHVFTLARRPSNFALGIHGFLATGVRAARRSIEVNGVTIGENQGQQAHAEFTAPFDAARPLGLQQLATKIRTHGDNDA